MGSLNPRSNPDPPTQSLYNWPTWLPFSHTMTSRQPSHCTSSLPRLHAGNCHPNHDPWSSPVTTTADHGRRWTRVWNLRNTGHKNQQPPSHLQTTLPRPLDRLQRHQWRNFVDTCFPTRTCFRTHRRLSRGLSSQTWSPVKTFLIWYAYWSHFFPDLKTQVHCYYLLLD